MIAAHREQAGQRHDRVERGGGISPVAGHVTETHIGLDSFSVGLSLTGLEGLQVAMDVGQDRKPHGVNVTPFRLGRV